MNSKKYITTIIIAILYSSITIAQNVGITDNGATFTPDASSVLELKSTSRGVLVPRVTTAQRTAIATPATGLLVYDTDTKTFWYFDVTWKNLSRGGLIDADGDTQVQVEESADEDYIRFDTRGVERMRIVDTGTVVMGTPGTNYTKITSDGTLRYEGTATTFDDLTVPGLAGKVGAAGFPDLVDYLTSLRLYGFDKDADQSLYFVVQMPHAWKAGSDIKPHVHWVAPTNATGMTVQWGLEYSWSNLASTFAAPTVITGTALAVPNGTDIIQDEHAITSLGTITGTGKTLSSTLICRLYRDANDAADTYNADALLLQIDFHYEIDSDGSSEEYTKN